MSSLDGREVSYAVTHNGVFVPTLGPLGPTLTADPASNKLKGLKMVISGQFLQVTLSGFEIAIPMTNVSHMRLKEVPPKEVHTKEPVKKT